MSTPGHPKSSFEMLAVLAQGNLEIGRGFANQSGLPAMGVADVHRSTELRTIAPVERRGQPVQDAPDPLSDEGAEMERVARAVRTSLGGSYQTLRLKSLLDISFIYENRQAGLEFGLLRSF
jgi:hypothetical protein